MNVIVVRSDGSWYVRPDTSIERESPEFYLPDGFSSVETHNCIWIRIIKAGKAVNPKFAGRYFDSFGKGVTIYCKEENSDGVCPFVDGSTLIRQETHPLECLETEAPEMLHTAATIAEAVCRISRVTSIRIGDLFLFESAASATLHRRQEAGGVAVL